MSFLDRLKQGASQAQAMVQQQADRHNIKLPAAVAGNTSHADLPQEPQSYDGTGSRAQVSSLNDLRQLVTRYNPQQSPHTLSLQMAIKAAKGVIESEGAVARDEKTFAKQMFKWSQLDESKDAEGLRDTGDRLAYLLWQSSEVHQDYAQSLEHARSALKDIRNFENKLAPNRDKRADTKMRLKKLVDSKAEPAKIESLKLELGHLEANDEAYEASILALKRQKMQEGFQLQFEAMRELGEKLAIIAGYGESLMSGLHGNGASYAPEGFQHSAQVREGVEHALANYNRKTPLIPPPSLGAPAPQATELSRASTISSFGQTHRMHLDDDRGHYDAPPLPAKSAPASSVAQPNINTTPVVVPESVSTTTSPPPRPVVDDPAQSHEENNAISQPTVAETGIPLATGTNGPASGQLKPRQGSMNSQGQPTLEAARQNLVAEAAAAPSGGIVSPPAPSSASKEDERRQEIEENFARYSNDEGTSLDRNSTLSVPPPYQAGSSGTQ